MFGNYFVARDEYFNRLITKFHDRELQRKLLSANFLFFAWFIQNPP